MKKALFLIALSSMICGCASPNKDTEVIKARLASLEWKVDEIREEIMYKRWLIGGGMIHNEEQIFMVTNEFDQIKEEIAPVGESISVKKAKAK